MAGAQGKAPAAARHKQPYRAAYASAGRDPAVTQPIPPAMDAPAMCHPRPLNRSAEYDNTMATTNPMTHGGTVMSWACIDAYPRPVTIVGE